MIQLHYHDRTGVALPPADAIDHSEIRAAVKAYEETKTRRWECWTETTNASARAAAVEADAQALAAGEPDPRADHVLQHDAEVADAARRAYAADVLPRRRIAEVQQALDLRRG